MEFERLLTLNMPLLYGFVTVLGMIIGSFLNVCIYRIPKRQSVVRPSSHCPQYQRPIRAWENIPVLSYLFLKGRCSQCLATISWVYPVVEALTGLLFLLLFLKYGLHPAFLVNALLCSILMVLLFIDLYERILPNLFTVGGLGLGFLLAPLQSPEFFPTSGPNTPFWTQYIDSLLGVVAGGGFLWLVAELYFRYKKVEGMGFGDIKMMAMVGAFVGWRFAWLTILLGSMLGAVVGSVYIYLLGKGRQYELPFGSFLAIAGILSVLWGKQIIALYLGQL